MCALLQILLLLGNLKIINQYDTVIFNNFNVLYNQNNVIDSINTVNETEEINDNFKYDSTVVEGRSQVLEKIFQIRPKNGFFHTRLNATDLFFMDIRLCPGVHNFFGTVQKNKLCLNNARSYGFTCYNSSATNFEKECSFNFCLDEESYGQGVISCED